MLENFLTIPDAPRYEINSELICRVKATGKILTLQIGDKNFRHYCLRRPDNRGKIKRSPETLRAQAVDAAKPDTSFLPIPSTGGKYEIDINGVVRVAKTKRIISAKNNGKRVNFYLDKCVARSIADLLWEVYGILGTRRFRPVPCFAENRHGKRFFPNLKACANFIADSVGCSVRALYQKYLLHRVNVIGGWTVTYLNNNLANVKWRGNSLSAIAHRQAILKAS